MNLTRFIHALLDATTAGYDTEPEVLILIAGQTYSISSVHQNGNGDLVVEVG